jgi:arylsulfatase A
MVSRTMKPLFAFAAILFGISAAAPSVEAATRPNVILIMADDLGYETIGANGGTSYRTPAIDQLAATGVRFDHCYVQPLCTPTRVQLMTGAYNVRNYIRFGLLDPKVKTFGNLFRDAGYKTCITGKWQLGQDPEAPKKFGFDEHYLWQHTRRPPRYANPGLEHNAVPQDYNDGEYGPTLINDRALDFVMRHRREPFFLYYPMILTHSPYQPTPDSPDWDPKAVGEKVNQDEKHFGEMVEYMDKMVGRLVTLLDTMGIRDNTLLIFIGDNGTGKGTKSMMGDRVVIGGKGSTTEFGMHVPCVVIWPAGIKKAAVCSDLVDSTDFLPTICEAAGIRLPANLTFDGRSFLPQVRGEKGSPRDWIYSWYSPRQQADLKVREFAFDHGHKLYRTGEFFDIANDPREERPLNVAALTGPQDAARAKLQRALDQFGEARPAELDRRFEAEAKGQPEKAAPKQKKKNK